MEVLEDIFVDLTLEIDLQLMRQVADDPFLLRIVILQLIFKLFLHIFFEISLNLIGHVVPLRYFIEVRQPRLQLFVFEAEPLEHAVDFADIVGEDEAGHHRNTDDENGLYDSCGVYIAKADGEHDADCPVIAPEILLVPIGVVHGLQHMPTCPVLFLAHHCCHIQEQGNGVRDDQIEYHDLDDVPILMGYVAVDDVDLLPLQ